MPCSAEIDLASSAAFAGEKTVTLSVQNMYCAACPHTVKASLEAVPGVAKVAVSYQDKTAIVTFDDSKTDVKTLTDATGRGIVLSSNGLSLNIRRAPNQDF
jgi:mercuric ion binding protein